MAWCNVESLEELYKQTLEKMSEWQKAYDEGHPVISDREWDDHYYSLINLERRLGYADPESPTQRIEYNHYDSKQCYHHRIRFEYTNSRFSHIILIN